MRQLEKRTQKFCSSQTMVGYFEFNTDCSPCSKITGLDINIGLLAQCPFWGCRASSGHKFSYFTDTVGHHSLSSFLIRLVTATGHPFNRLFLPSTPAPQLNTIFISSAFVLSLCIATILFRYVRASPLQATTVYEASALWMPMFY